MGYYTDYTIRAGNFANESEITVFLGMLQKQSGYVMPPADITHNGTKLCVFINAKWYDWESDLLAMSRVYPNITMEVEGVGEERRDIWRARVHNDRSETVQAEIVFPDFQWLT